MPLCPICLKNNTHNSLVNIGIYEKLLICENDDCPYVENDEISKNVITNSSILSSTNYCADKSQDCVDLDIDLSSTDSEDENSYLLLKHQTTFIEYSTHSVQRHLQHLVKIANQVPFIFNWFGMPLMLKFNEMYYRYENMVNQVPKKVVSLFALNFMSFIYDKHTIFKLANINKLDMTERILKSMDNFIISMENHCSYKSIYNFKESCTSCGYKISYIKEDFSIKLLSNFQYGINQFSYQHSCKKCFGISDVSIKIEKLARFIFIDCPNGVNKNFNELNEIIFTRPFDNNIQLQAIIEYKCPSLVDDVPEKAPEIKEFVLKNICKQKINYNIFFRNTDGWYKIDSVSGNLIDPIAESEIRISPANIRLLVFAEKNNANDFRRAGRSTVPLYTVLENYKKPIPGFVNYPSSTIKYWIILLKYRDFCLRKSDFSKSFFTETANCITEKLNCHLKRRENRMKRKKNVVKHEDSDIVEDKFVTSEMVNEIIKRDPVEVEPNPVSVVIKDDTDESLSSFTKPTIANIPSDTGTESPPLNKNIKIEADYPVKQHTNIFTMLKEKSESISKMSRPEFTEPLLDELIEMKRRRIMERK